MIDNSAKAILIIKKHIHKLYKRCEHCNNPAEYVEYDSSGTGYFCKLHYPNDEENLFCPVGEIKVYSQDKEIMELVRLLETL